jgi:hypothetical protein
MGSADLPESAATVHISKIGLRVTAVRRNLSSVMLHYVRYVSTKLHEASIFYSVPLRLSDVQTHHAYISVTDNKLRRKIEWQSKILSISWLPVGGRNVAAWHCMKNKTRRRALRILANQLIPFYIGSSLFFLNHTDANGNFKNQRGACEP